MTQQKFIIKQLQNGVIKSDNELLEVFTKRFTNIFWTTPARFRLQCSFWRVLKDMRQRGKIKEVVEMREIVESKINGAAGNYHIIYYRLP